MRQQLAAMREVMAAHSADWYLVLTDDFHSSEYVGDYFKSRAYLSGFTGSAGTLLIGKDWAGLWTDGRYFLQASQQLEGSGIDLMKMGEPGVPDLLTYLEQALQPGQTLAFDGRTVNTRLYKRLQGAAKKEGASLCGENDLVGLIWKDRPALSAKPVFELSAELVGKSREEKLHNVREELAKAGADCLVLSSLMDICWLTNLRGGDVACTPVVLSYMMITADKAVLFVNPAVLSDEIRSGLVKDGITVAPYENILNEVKQLAPSCKVQMNLAVVNSAIYAAVPAGVEVIDKPDPTTLPKAIKNPVEVANMREAHIKDGVAVTRLMYWLKKNIGKVPMDELSVAEVLEGFRREQPNYLEPSFDPIIGWGPHGAIIHYKATEESNCRVEPRSFLLADTGGHYLEGTTDITRTFAMGPLTAEEKRFYTLVLKGHLNLGAAKFRYGSTGQTLDYVAHAPLWAIGMDYNHGTGHGVGYMLAVHEGPQNFRWKALPGQEQTVLEPGMITSDEPGFYAEGKFGVRLENLTVVCETETTSYGRFLHLEYLTMVPFDLDAIDLDLLQPYEKDLLNEYHQQVLEKIGPRLNPEEAAWLREATRKV